MMIQNTEPMADPISPPPTEPPPEPPVADEEDTSQVPDTAAQLAEIKAEMSELRTLMSQKLAPPAAPKPPKDEVKPPDVDYAQLVYEDANKAFAVHADQVRQQVLEEVTTAYNQRQAMDGFWNNFNRQYPDLAPHQDWVDQLMHRHMAELHHLSPEQAAPRLAVIARAEMQKIASSAKRVVVTGGSAPAPEKPKTEPKTELKHVSMGDMIRVKNAERRRAARGG